MLDGHHSIIKKWKSVYTFGKPDWLNSVSEISDSGTELSSIEAKEDTSFVQISSNKQTIKKRYKILKVIRRVIILCYLDTWIVSSFRFDQRLFIPIICIFHCTLLKHLVIPKVYTFFHSIVIEWCPTNILR